MAKLDELILALKNDGVNQTEIDKTVEFISQIVAGKYYAELMANFTQEEISEVNKAESQEQADVEIKLKYFRKTNKSLDDLRNEMFDFYSGQILDDYLKTKKLPKKE